MKELITLTYWRQGHPLPVESASDFYYVNLARHLYNTICATEIGRQSTKVWVAETAMNVAYYMEDVISGLGFWRVFVEKHKSLYGKYLPFYAIDESDYYMDEVNLPDLCFLLWMSVQNNKRETLVNPENPYLMDLASALYRQLDKEFEKAPINDVLLGYLKSPDTYKTFDKLGWPRKGIIGVTMPGFGTTDRTYTNALHLMTSLGVTVREVSIRKACLQHFEDIGHDPAVHDVVYENSQARERTQILMDIANQTGGLVIGTGDLSELALGWATYNGDHMSMYGVNASVPKTLVKHLVKWVAENDVDDSSRRTLLDIVDTPISPELIPADADGRISQITEDLVGPYELHDFFLYHFLRGGFRPSKIAFLAVRTFKDVYDEETIRKWLHTFLRRFFNQQFKRSCLPDGPKVGSVSLSPRGDWRMPSDASSEAWLAEC